MAKKCITIGLEFLEGPIICSLQDKNESYLTRIKVVDEDKIVRSLHDEISKTWLSLWTENPEVSSGWDFDEKKEKELAPYFLDKINQLENRLNKINDGSYELFDIVTDRLKRLINRNS